MTEKRYSWTQPCCGYCFQEINPGRGPTRVKGAGTEKCCRCGVATVEGIYIRTDPTAVLYPTITKN